MSSRRSAVTKIGGLVVLATAMALAWYARFPGPRPATAYHALVVRAQPDGAGVRVDLYAPASSPVRPPLAVFVPGGLRYRPDENDLVGPAFADAMQRRGIATLVVQFTLSDAYRLAPCTEDIAAALRDALAKAEDDGVDARHPVFVGHGLGATIASRLVLDEALAARAGLDVRTPGGVIAGRGTYDFSDAALTTEERAFFAWAFAGDAAARAQASPTEYARAGAPPFLLLHGGDDAPEWARRARAWARALGHAGANDVQRYALGGRDGWSLLNVGGSDNDVGDLVASFIHGERSDRMPLEPFGAKRIWGAHPPLSSEPFWENERLVITRSMDAGVKSMLARVFRDAMYELDAWAQDSYTSIDLGAYLASRPAGEIGAGDYLVVTNFRGEQLYLTRRDLERYRPVIVIGVDDERNLYRLFTTYRIKRDYSWLPEAGPMPLMIRPVGAFLYFPEGAPPELLNTSYAPFGLTKSSFHWFCEDPLDKVRTFSAALEDTLLGKEGCLTCHTLRGQGAEAHHVRAEDGVANGAVGLALEAYPSAVVWRFLLDQDAVAESFGVAPLHVDDAAGQALMDILAAEPAPP